MPKFYFIRPVDWKLFALLVFPLFPTCTSVSFYSVPVQLKGTSPSRRHSCAFGEPECRGKKKGTTRPRVREIPSVNATRRVASGRRIRTLLAVETLGGVPAARCKPAPPRRVTPLTFPLRRFLFRWRIFSFARRRRRRRRRGRRGALEASRSANF